MPNKFSILCGGTNSPQNLSRQDFEVKKVDLFSASENPFFQIETSAHGALKSIPEQFIDLLEISTYVNYVDQYAKRSNEEFCGLWGDDRRHFQFILPVRKPDFWNSSEVQDALQDCLNFLTQDYYNFAFVKHSKPNHVNKYFKQNRTDTKTAKVDNVVLFQGGIESLSGVISEVITNKHKIALVTSCARSKSIPWRVKLIDAIKKNLEDKYEPQAVSVSLNIESVQESLNSSSFLNATLGAIVAVAMQTNHLTIFRNGIDSIGFPVIDRQVNVNIDRKTHPETLKNFNKIFSLVADQDFTVNNPFLMKTRTDIVKELKNLWYDNLIKFTNDCSSFIPTEESSTHCGLCLDCLRRRFSSIAASCTESDSEDSYQDDIFTTDLSENENLINISSYVRKFSKIDESDNRDTFFRFHGDIHKIIYSLDGNCESNVESIYNLLKREGNQLVEAMKWGNDRYQSEWDKGTLPETCLLSLYYGHVSGYPYCVESDNAKLNHLSVEKSNFKGDVKIINTSLETNWENIRIEFIDEKIVKIHTLDKCHTRTYIEMGFKDHKSRPPKPNIIWDLLVDFAKKEGRIDWGDNRTQMKDAYKVKNYVSFLRKRLKLVFPNINGAPVKIYRKGTGYETEFVIKWIQF